ncbi:MAG: GAF domain-containing protein [Chloroflexi bacterium]|nr:GAF domain-containing protein [Chloroflexota bacterium]
MNNQTGQLAPEQERRKRNALSISLGTGILFTIITAIVGPIGFRDNGIGGLWGVALTAFVAVAAFIGAFLVSRNRTSAGIGVLICTILLMALALPVVAQGQGLALGIMILVLVAGISSVTLPPTWAARAIISAFLIAIIITLTDLYFPDFGLPTNPGYSNPIAILTTLIYLFFTLRRFNEYTLRTKIILAFALVTIIPLAVLGYSNNRASSKALEEQSRKQLSTLAGVAADNLDSFINEQLDTVLSDAKQLAFVEYLNLPPFRRFGSKEEENARRTILALTRKNPVFIHSIGILDINGNNLLDSSDEYQGTREGNFPYFLRPLQTKLPYASNIIFYDGEANLYFSAPIIDNQTGETVGVLRIAYNAVILQSIVRQIETGTSDTTISIIDSNTYLQIANTANRKNLFTTIRKFTNLEIAALQAENKLPGDAGAGPQNDLDETLVAGMDNLAQQPFFNSSSKSSNSTAINTGEFLETQPWIALVQQPTKVYLAPVREQSKTTILWSLGLIILSVVAGYFASQILTSPLITLSRVAEKITSGDRSARAVANTEDEIGTLARSFNRMTDELNQTFSNLEVRVAERTTDLEIARQQSENRARELQSIGEISKVITGEQKLENLLPLICRLVSERFGFYHTGIFLVDETRQFAVLQAANSDGGKNMLERGHKLEVGGGGIVGYVAKFGAPRIALDVGLDAVFFNNPDLPNTRSEMALPLKVRDQIAGVLDVQSEKPGIFTENDANTLSILADQIAIALENARLFTQTQQALNEARALYRQNSQESWLLFSREESTVGYQHGIKGGKKINTPVDTDEIRQAMNSGNVLILNRNENNQEPSIVVPIKLRGQIIGALNIKAPTHDRRWSSDEVNLAEAISERLSLALENARLIQESQRQVIKEQTISDVTGKIGASINLKNVLQTAVEELGRAIPGSEVILQLQNENDNGNQS